MEPFLRTYALCGVSPCWCVSLQSCCCDRYPSFCGDAASGMYLYVSPIDKKWTVGIFLSSSLDEPERWALKRTSIACADPHDFESPQEWQINKVGGEVKLSMRMVRVRSTCSASNTTSKKDNCTVL